MTEPGTLQPRGGFTLRAILLSVVLAIVFSVINGYLSINLGMNFGYGAVAVIVAYGVLHRLFGGSSRRELGFVLIASGSSMALYQILAFLIYATETDPDASFAYFLAPSREAILGKSLSFSDWWLPVAFISFTSIISMISGVIFTTILRDSLNRSPKMVWPQVSPTTKLVDACMAGGGSVRLVAVAAAVGFAVTLLQHVPSLWGVNLTSVNLSFLLPQGAFLVASLSIAFAALGYLSNTRTSLSLFAAGAVTYLVVSPYLVSTGVIEYTPDVQSYYNSFMTRFTMSPAIGVMLLGGILLSVFSLIKVQLNKRKPAGPQSEAELGYLELFKVLAEGIVRNPRNLALVAGTLTVSLGVAWFLNPFQPLSPTFAVLFTLYSFFVGGVVELIFITRIQGETGMGVGIISSLLYDFPIFASGYRGYTAYWSYYLLHPNPWFSGGSLPYYKYREETELSWRDILLAKAVGWGATLLTSVVITLLLWRYIGFGNEAMPATGLLQSRVYTQMLAEGNLGSTLNPVTFVAGGVIGALLELFTPVSMMGVGMGLFLPPGYFIPMGLGGLARWYTDRKYGKDFYNEKGRLIVTGLMASSLLVQVFMTILANVT